MTIIFEHLPPIPSRSHYAHPLNISSAVSLAFSYEHVTTALTGQDMKTILRRQITTEVHLEVMPSAFGAPARLYLFYQCGLQFFNGFTLRVHLKDVSTMLTFSRINAFVLAKVTSQD
jgi:hypothetical protein